MAKQSFEQSKELALTVKNYHSGLSRVFHESMISRKVKISGPHGLGLELDSEHVLSGTHIAFTGGTGILPFMDFAAHIAQELLTTDPPEFAKDFKFVLFVRFKQNTPTKALGIELLELLDKNSRHFELRVNTMSKSAEETLFKMQEEFGSVEKLWVCGPPQMTEDYENALKESDLDF